MTDWIEINLPWYSYSISDRKSIIDHDAIQARAKAELGKSYRESQNSISEELQNEYIKFRNDYEEDHDATNDASKEAARALEKFAVIKVHQDFVPIYNEWYARQPEVIEQRRLDEIARKENAQKSFCGRKLNNSGTLIEYISAYDGSLHQELIGSINQLGGVCDDCRGIESNDIVKRYKIVYDFKDIK